MSSYNNIRKIKYAFNPADPVTLKEYILFEDDRDKNKFAVFKFANNVNQHLRAIKFEVFQLDKDGKTLEKSVVLYDGFVSEPNAPFVPNAKLALNFGCAALTVKVVFAVFDRVKWQDGEFTDASYKFDRYASDTVAARAAAEKPSKPSAPASPKKADKPKKKQRAGINDIYRKNFAKFPKVFNILVCVCVLAWVGATLAFFIHTDKRQTIDGYDVRVISEDTVSLIGYDGDSAKLTVPAKIGDYYVESIGKGAFKGLDITEVTFKTSGALVIESEAFSGCEKLTSVKSDNLSGKLTLMENSFSDCTKLKEVNLPTATLFPSALKGCNGVKELSFGSFIKNGVTLSDVFAADKNSTVALDKLNCGATYIPEGFFGGVTVKEANFDLKSLTAEFGALKDAGLTGYCATSSCEVLSGEVVSVKPNSRELTIPRYATSFNPDKFLKLINSVEKLTVLTNSADKNYLEVTSGLIASFPALTSIEIADGVMREGALDGFDKITEFTAPVLKNPLKNYISGSAVNCLYVTGGGTLTAAYLGGCAQLNSVTVDAAVTGVHSDAFSGLGLSELSVPCFAGRKMSAYSGLENLRKITLTPYGRNAYVPEGCFDGLPYLTSITVAEGFTAIRSGIVSSSLNLRRLYLPDGITSFNYPVIGSGCTSLTNVSVSFVSAPKSYSEFNGSYEYTESLSLGAPSLSAGFFDGAERITALRLKCDALGAGFKGFAGGLDNLNYLQLEAKTVSAKLSDLLGEGRDNSRLYTLVLRCEALPDLFFSDCDLSKTDVLLADIKGISARTFTRSDIARLYFTQSLVYDKALFDAIKGLDTEFSFKGTRPQNNSILNQGQKYNWSVDGEKLLLKEF